MIAKTFDVNNFNRAEILNQVNCENSKSITHPTNIICGINYTVFLYKKMIFYKKYDESILGSFLVVFFIEINEDNENVHTLDYIIHTRQSVSYKIKSIFLSIGVE